MTISEYIEQFLMSREESMSGEVDENAAIEVSDLVSGSFVYALFECVIQADMDTDVITEHLEYLYDSANHFGVIYFIMFLADAAGFHLPKEFYVISLKNELVPILSAAIMEDWIEADE